MRAEYVPYLEELIPEKEIAFKVSEFPHLIKVARVKIGEEVLLLNGQGLGARGVISNIQKKEFQVSLRETIQKRRDYNIDLLLGLPKKDTLEDAIDFCTQLGISKVYLWKSEYSQLKSIPRERLEKISISALKQSNNFFIPELIEISDPQSDLDFSHYERSYLMSLKDSEDKGSEFSSSQKVLFVIGPEGGLSEKEEGFLKNNPGFHSIHLPSPILKVVPAISASMGYLFSLLRD